MVKLRAYPGFELSPWRRRARTDPRAKEKFGLRLGVHDSSRVEWVATVALPNAGAAAFRYNLEFLVDVPQHLYLAHNMWERKQTFTRLQSPQEEGELRIERGDVDELRRDALGVAHRLKTLRDRAERMFEGACHHPPVLPDATVQRNLIEAVAQAEQMVSEVRTWLDAPSADRSNGRLHLPEIRQEWVLADEFLSHQLLDFLGSAQRAIDAVAAAGSNDEPAWLASLHEQVGDALAAELEIRSARGYVNPVADSPKQLARFLERASQLKKHFQDVLFLDDEAYMVDHKVRNLTAVVAAALAYCYWMIFSVLFSINPAIRLSLGVVFFSAGFAAAYALRDRVKDVTQNWLQGRLTRLYGQRAVTLRLPLRFDPARPVLAEMSEVFNTSNRVAKDSLNKTLGPTQKMTEVSYRMAVELHGAVELERKGISSIKHVFRYDLSPIFARLDDASKPVPTLDASTRRVRLVAAPKEYRLPVRLRAYSADGKVAASTEGHLVISKRGVERLEQF